jgi:hypothetical protein
LQRKDLWIDGLIFGWTKLPASGESERMKLTDIQLFTGDTHMIKLRNLSYNQGEDIARIVLLLIAVPLLYRFGVYVFSPVLIMFGW